MRENEKNKEYIIVKQTEPSKNIKDIVPYILNNSIVKSNRLIQAKYKGGILEEKIVYAALFAAQNKKLLETHEGYEVVISSNELKEMTNYKGGSFYEKLKPAAAALMLRVYGIEDPENDSFEYIHLISKCSYSNGEFKIVFNKEQRKLLMNLTSNFTRLPMMMMSLKNVYAFRLYELLKSECYYKKDTPKEMRNNVFNIIHSVSELKLALGVVDSNAKEVRNILEREHPDYDKAISKSQSTMYNVNSDFVKYVISKAVNEINDKLDIHVEYSTKKLGKQIHDISFIVNLNGSKAKVEIPVKEMTEDELFEFHANARALFDNKFGLTEIKKISEESGYNIERLEEIKKAMDSSKVNIDNPMGYILKALREDYDFSYSNCDAEDEEDMATISPEIMEEAKSILGDRFSDTDVMSIIIVADNDLEKIRKAKEILDNKSHVKNAVGFILTAIKKEYKEVESYSKQHRDMQGIMRENIDYDEMIKQKTIASIDQAVL